jgi:hypothetical protein
MNARIRAFPDHGLLVWVTMTAGLAAWTVHLVSFAALVQLVETHHHRWIFTVGNIACVAITLGALFLSWSMVRAAGDAPEDAGTPEGRIKFLGLLGLAVNGFNLSLIVLEGIYVYVLSGRHA